MGHIMGAMWHGRATKAQVQVSLVPATPSPCIGSMPRVKKSKVNNLAHGTLGHAIEHGQIKGSHMTLTVQCQMFIYTKGRPCGMGGQQRPKSRLA